MSRLCCWSVRRSGILPDLSFDDIDKVDLDKDGGTESGDRIRPEPEPKPSRSGKRSAVLVELFTAQGCTSCPAAESLISRLGRGEDGEGIPVVILAFHVEYWDYLGWKDPFASSSWTLRQRNYGQAHRIFTPEIVVQGHDHSIGFNTDRVLSLIRTAPRYAAPEVQAKFSRPSPQSLRVSITMALKFKVEGFTVDAMLALHESGLETEIDKGENKGLILLNDFVVKGMLKVCSLRDWPAKKTARGEVTFDLWEGFDTLRCRVSLVLQNPVSMQVYGAQHLALPLGL